MCDILHVQPDCILSVLSNTIEASYLYIDVGLYDAIILDVDSKDVSAGISSPPQAFVEQQFLTNTQLLLKRSGKFMNVSININAYKLL